MPCLYKPTGGENKDGHWDEGCRRPSPSCPANTTIQTIDLVLKINKKEVIKLILMVSIILNSQICIYFKQEKFLGSSVLELVFGTPGMRNGLRGSLIGRQHLPCCCCCLG